MTGESNLFDRRVEELDVLINAHLERGSLDEGNASAFDAIIDAWLHEETARLTTEIVDLEAAAEATRTAALVIRERADSAAREARAVAEAETEHQRELQRIAELRWQQIDDQYALRRAAVDEARRARHEARVESAEARLTEAVAALTNARELLLGSSTRASTVVVDAGDRGPDGDDEPPIFGQDTARVA